MSMVLTRAPLDIIGMNTSGTQKRRSARLSHEGDGENEPPAKKAKVNGAMTTTINTKQQDGENSKATGKKKRKVYDRLDDDFAFTKGRRSKPKDVKDTKKPKATEETGKDFAVPPPIVAEPPSDIPAQADTTAESDPRTAKKKTRRQLPTTPELAVTMKTTRRSKRLSDDKATGDAARASPHKAAHAQSHANTHRSSSPGKVRPLTVEKRRKHGVNGVEEEKVMTISLPFADTPIIRRNKEMRKNSADTQRRSSAGMRGKRASSLIDEGRGHALPHPEVPTSEYYKHISADLTEPRRMRCLLGWCGTRALPAEVVAAEESGPRVQLEFEAMQAARKIQQELSQDLMIKGTLSDWFSRDESVQPRIPLRRRPNPRNLTNASKAEELERELERLKAERAEWDEVVHSADFNMEPHDQDATSGRGSPLRLEALDSPQRAIVEQFNQHQADSAARPEALEERLRTISQEMEFTVDKFAHGIHVLSTTKDNAERAAECSLSGAAHILEQREMQRGSSGTGVDQMDVLRGLARVLNTQHR